MDIISIKRLEVYAFHGVFKEENIIGQKFYVSADLYLDTFAASLDDDLEKSVNYGEICDIIVKFMQTHQFKLIETTAEKLAEYLLTSYDAVSKIVIDLEKPNAPIAHALKTVNLHIERARHTAYIGIGSNMGDRKMFLDLAVSMLNEDPLTQVKAVSSIYETAPYGYTDQPAFLNGCVKITTIYSPEYLLILLNDIERQLGRKREIHWGPRTIDLDILLYDNLVIDTEKLHIPHIDMQNRLFVLKPLSEIAGYVRHPYLNRTIDQLLADIEDQ